MIYFPIMRRPSLATCGLDGRFTKGSYGSYEYGSYRSLFLCHGFLNDSRFFQSSKSLLSRSGELLGFVLPLPPSSKTKNRFSKIPNLLNERWYSKGMLLSKTSHINLLCISIIMLYDNRPRRIQVPYHRLLDTRKTLTT